MHKETPICLGKPPTPLTFLWGVVATLEAALMGELEDNARAMPAALGSWG